MRGIRRHTGGVYRDLSRASATLFAATLAIMAQAPRPQFNAFDVATIKPTGPEPNGRWIRMESANRFMAHNHAVRTLIAAAYDLNPQAILFDNRLLTRVGGTAWVDSDRWDIVAKTPGEIRPNLDEQMSMLRQLLGERFKLTFHREPKQLSIYTLSIAKGGSKLKESTTSPDATPEGPPPLIFVNAHNAFAVRFALSPTLVRLPARYTTMAEFASVLQRSPLDRPVVDRTGLSGRYDFDLEFAPDDRLWGGAVPRPENSDKPDLFEALQEQLGLRLEATKGPVEALVIDRIERPSEN
jgi:uncharacterized protein (TIGR03435 family)